MLLTWISPDDIGHCLVSKLAHVKLSWEEDILTQIPKVCVLMDNVFICAWEEQTAMIGIAWTDNTDVRKTLK